MSVARVVVMEPVAGGAHRWSLYRHALRSHLVPVIGAKLGWMSTEQASIVVIEDDPNIADLVSMYLGREGFRVFLAADAEAGMQAVQRFDPVLVVLDIGLPGRMDGLDVCRSLQALGKGGSSGSSASGSSGRSSVPVVMLTARADELDRVLGLEIGADDYITKPFSPRELVARVKAVLRRTGGADPPGNGSARGGIREQVEELGLVRVELGRRQASRAGVEIGLTAQEFDLLALLIGNRGLALSRRQLLDGAWGEGWVGDERTVDVHVRQLRRKLGDDIPLVTVWGVGYRLD